MLYPTTTDVLAVQLRAAECCTATPVPESDTDSGEFEALLVMTTPPAVSEPALVGANITFIGTEAPGVRTRPFEIPLTLRPAPLIVTLEIITLAAPELVTVVLCVLLLPTFTFPKLKVELPALSWPGAVTVSVIVLLVTLAIELVTVTLNCEPLSELAVAGVV